MNPTCYSSCSFLMNRINSSVDPEQRIRYTNTMEEKKLDGQVLAKLLGNALDAWENVDRVEIVVKDLDNNIEGVGSLVNNVVKDIKNCKTNIKEIHATLFFDDEKDS